MNGTALELRLSEVERRLRRVESWVGVPPAAAPAEDRRDEGRSRAFVAPLPVIELLAAPPNPPPAAMPKPVIPTPLPVEYRPVVPPPAAPSAPARGGVEQAIGLKWAGWVGAIVLVIGAGLGIKFAYDNGWFGAVPPSARVALIAAIGFALIGAGEWVFRRVEQLAAVGLFSAGVAILFLDSYAGFRFYNLYAREVAFVLMGISTLVGAGVAMRGRLVSIGVLSILGGQLAPALLAGPTPSLTSFFAYLLLLQAVALVLAWWGGSAKWWTLRSLALACTALWVVAVSGAMPASGAAVPFLLISAVMFQGELILSTGRLDPVASGRARGVAFSTMVTAALSAGLLLALRDASAPMRGTWVMLVALACAGIGFALPSARTTWAALRVAYRVQAAGLLVVAVPVWFSGMSVEVGWAGLAVVYALLAERLDLPIARAAAVVTWCLAAGHLALRGADSGQHEFVWFATRVSSRTVEAWCLALAAQLIAILTARSVKSLAGAVQIGRVMSVLGSVYFAVSSMTGLPSLGATFAIAAYAWVLAAVDRVDPRTRAAMQAVAAVSLAAVKWAVVDLLAERLSAGWPAGQRAALLNPAMLVGGFLAVSIVGAGWLWRGRLEAALGHRGAGDRARRDAVVLIAGLVIALMAIGLSFEVDRCVELRLWSGAALLWPAGQLKQLLWTVLWSGACASFCSLARRAEASSVWLRVGGRLAMALAVKFLLVDAIGYRLVAGVALAPPVLNAQVIAALAVVGALAASGRRGQHVVFLVVLMLLVSGAAEIDRTFARFAASGAMPPLHAALARQVALSIYGGIFAVGLVVVGFRWPSAMARYCGLALFGLTLAKVVLVDLQNAGQGYRILSFIGVGLLLLGTSVLYGKLSPRLLSAGAGLDPTLETPAA